MRNIQLLLILILTTVLAACGPQFLRKDSSESWQEADGFQIDEAAEIVDTPEHRQLVDLLVKYREAMVEKDVGQLKRLVASDYYENAGTTDTTTDDYGASDLASIFEMVSKHASQIRYDVTLKNIEIKGDEASIDYEYRYAYRYEVGEQQTWDAGVELNRIELEDRDGEWKIVSGL